MNEEMDQGRSEDAQQNKNIYDQKSFNNFVSLSLIIEQSF